MTVITEMTNVMDSVLIIISRDKFAMLEIGKKINVTVSVFLTHRMEKNIHVGRWSEDKPVGTGAIFDEDGNLSFAGRIENGMRQGVGFLTKWKMIRFLLGNGKTMFLLEKALSLMEMEILFTQVCGKTENVMVLVQNITKKEKLFYRRMGK